MSQSNSITRELMFVFSCVQIELNAYQTCLEQNFNMLEKCKYEHLAYVERTKDCTTIYFWSSLPKK